MKATHEDVFSYVVEFIAEHRYSPSIREVARHFDIVNSAAKQHLDALQSAGRIRRTPNVARSIVLTS